MTEHELIILIPRYYMRSLSPITGNGNQKALVNKINQLIAQNNKQKEEIRQIKQKLRVNAHFGHRS